MTQLTLEDLLSELQETAVKENLIPQNQAVIKTDPEITLDYCQKLKEQILDAEISVVEMRKLFEVVVKNEDNLKQQLEKLTKPEICKRIFSGWVNKNDKKSSLVDQAYRGFVSMFAPVSYQWSPFTETITDAIRREVNKLTDEQLQEIAQERRNHKEAWAKALTNPETLEEFNKFVGVIGVEKLTPEQREKYEQLKGGSDRQWRKNRKGWDATRYEITLPEGYELTPVQHTVHTKHGYDLYVVALNQYLDDKDLWRELDKRAKLNEGKYSSYDRDGAIPGWQFRQLENAVEFRQLGKIDGAELVENQEQARKRKAVEHLLEVSGSLKATAKEILAVQRLTNTVRRANIASMVESEAYSDIQLAKTMARLAQAIANNEVTFIDRMRHKTEVEDFESMLSYGQYKRWRQENERYRDGAEYVSQDAGFVEYSYPHGNKSNLLELAQRFKTRPGLKLVCNRIIKRIQADKHEYSITFRYKDEIEDLRALLAIARSAVPKAIARKYPSTNWQTELWQNNLLKYDRLVRLDLLTEAELRTALREYLQFRGKKPTQDPLTMLRRSIVGRKIAGYVPTPKDLSERMADMACIKDGMKVCDPNAGTGHLLDPVRNLGYNITLDAVEINYQLRQILEACQYNIVANDFLDSGFNQYYDRFVANPAFEGANDVLTVQKMYKLLNPKGKIVCIVSESCFSNSQQPYSGFKQWFYSLPPSQRYDEKLPEGTFLKSDVRTGVNTRLITITKP